MADELKTDDPQEIKQAFFEHLRKKNFTGEHLKVYDDYFEFFLSHLGEAKLSELEPQTIYQLALGHLEELDGEEVVEAYLQMLEYFTAFWAERWPDRPPDEASSSPD